MFSEGVFFEAGFGMTRHPQKNGGESCRLKNPEVEKVTVQCGFHIHGGWRPLRLPNTKREVRYLDPKNIPKTPFTSGGIWKTRGHGFFDIPLRIHGTSPVYLPINEWVICLWDQFVGKDTGLVPWILCVLFDKWVILQLVYFWLILIVFLCFFTCYHGKSPLNPPFGEYVCHFLQTPNKQISTVSLGPNWSFNHYFMGWIWSF